MPRKATPTPAQAFAARQQSRAQERRNAAIAKRNKAIIRAQERTQRAIEEQSAAYVSQLIQPMNDLPLRVRVRLAWDLIRRRFGVTARPEATDA
ncbi:MAG TPA: hypothetical protein PLG73_09035 [Candidatus Sumerlaeota bacterium]|nr:hypothetical protein [Candidatus Sumerlaeota bacterium]